MKSMRHIGTYAFCDLHIDARAGRDVLAGGGEGDLDVLGKHGRSQSQDCKEGFHSLDEGRRCLVMLGDFAECNYFRWMGDSNLYTSQC